MSQRQPIAIGISPFITLDGRCFVAKSTLHEPGFVIRFMERDSDIAF
ncbi:uncharacterized protein METZ01_LOCUS49395 [marine metagenome]|uniref:Uncharacterized protein n=1 Tax=marine metagenome TaxID=408172 RepID=A0A381RZI6_9ZZZZ